MPQAAKKNYMYDNYEELKFSFSENHNVELKKVKLLLTNIIDFLCIKAGVPKGNSFSESIKTLETAGLPKNISVNLHSIRRVINHSMHADTINTNEVIECLDKFHSLFIFIDKIDEKCSQKHGSDFQSVENSKSLYTSMSNSHIYLSRDVDLNKWLPLIHIKLSLDLPYELRVNELELLKNQKSDLLEVGVVNQDILKAYQLTKLCMDEIEHRIKYQSMKLSLTQARPGSIDIDMIIHFYNDHESLINVLTSVKDWGGWLLSAAMVFKGTLSQKLIGQTKKPVEITLDEETLKHLSKLIREQNGVGN